MYSRGEEVGNTSLVLNPCSFAEMKKKINSFSFSPKDHSAQTITGTKSCSTLLDKHQ